jgi:hypothetical protein
MAQAVASRLVFVPPIGFRPAGTRTLRERVETTADGTKLTVLAIAAAPDRTDVLIEWERTGDPATCPPESKLFVHSNWAPLENGLAAELAIGTTRLKALWLARRSFHLSHGSIGAVDAISFPALARDADGVEIRLSEGASLWRMPLALVLGAQDASPLAASAQRDGVVIRATALTRNEDELTVELEVEAPMGIRQVGAGLPIPQRYSGLNDDDYRMRLQEHRRVLGEHVHPITLEDDGGTRHEEVFRLLPIDPRQLPSGHTFKNRFSVVFGAPSADAKSATLSVPFVDLNDREGSVTADLRDVPLDLTLGAHHFHVFSAEPVAANRPRVVLEARPSPSPPRFRHPSRMYGVDPTESSWPGTGVGEQVHFDATVGDPPVVTFTGAVLRVDGPIELEIPLA